MDLTQQTVEKRADFDTIHLLSTLEMYLFYEKVEVSAVFKKVLIVRVAKLLGHLCWDRLQNWRDAK